MSSRSFRPIGEAAAWIAASTASSTPPVTLTDSSTPRTDAKAETTPGTFLSAASTRALPSWPAWRAPVEQLTHRSDAPVTATGQP